MKPKLTIYTAIFGGYDTLIEQPKFPGVEYICFTDIIPSNPYNWTIKCIPALYTDPNRCAKRPKVLPHELNFNTDWSLWIDGNIEVLSNPADLIDPQHDYMLYNHMETFDKRDCIYKEAQAIIELGNIHPERKYKDNPELIIKQMQYYASKGMPKDYGLVTTPIILRKHYNFEVMYHNVAWWKEISYWSKRDQLSFDYVRWKLKTNIEFLEGDSRNNKYFRNVGGHFKIK